MKLFLWVCLGFGFWGGPRAENARKNPSEDCLVQILNQYFDKATILIVIEAKIRRKEPEPLGDSEADFAVQMLQNLMKRSKWTFQVSSTNAYGDWPSELKLKRPKTSLIFLQQHEEWDVHLEQQVQRLRRNPLWQPVGRNLVVVKSKNPTTDEENLAREVIERVWKSSGASDVLVMVIGEDESRINLYTWFPYSSSNCREVRDIVHVDTFRNFEFERRANLFPAKVGFNLNGCEVVAAVKQCIPYVFSHHETGYMEKGIEIELVNTLAERLNFRLSLVEVADLGATNETFKLLVEGKVEVAFSCLHLNWERHLLSQALHPYLYDSLVWFVPSPTLVTYASDIFSAFSYSMWSAVVATAVASSLVVVYMTTSHEPENRNSLNSFLKVIAMSLTTPVYFATQHPVFRIFVFLFYIYSFHISMFFQGALYDHFREPHLTGVYRSVDQAIDEGLYVYLYQSTKHFYNETSTRLWNKILRPGRFRYIEHFEDALRQIAYDKNAIALYIHIVGAYMATVAHRDNNDLPRISWLDEKYSSYPVTMYLSPGSPLLPPFQTQIHRLLASGLLNYWLTQIVDPRGAVNIRDLRAFSTYGMGPLTWNHLNGSFSIFSILIFLAFLVFLWELLTFSYDFNPRRQRINRKLKAWLKKSRQVYP